MEQSNDQSLRLAVLIDADNASRTAMRDVMAEIAVYGTPTIKRIYGDWTTPNMASWKPILLENAITPIQQYSYTTGKNSTDSAMIIDAMDILYTGQCDGFVLVSSDSDFTRLATRLREAGKKVIGMGEKKTPSPFIVACDKFIYIEVIRAAAKDKAAKPEPAPEPEAVSAPAEGPRRARRGRRRWPRSPRRAGTGARAGGAAEEGPAGDRGADRRRPGYDRRRRRIRLYGGAGKPADPAAAGF
ncbi:MAG: NYN domain-containing protein [Intestinimonas sp.]